MSPGAAGPGTRARRPLPFFGGWRVEMFCQEHGPGVGPPAREQRGDAGTKGFILTPPKLQNGTSLVLYLLNKPGVPSVIDPLKDKRKCLCYTLWSSRGTLPASLGPLHAELAHPSKLQPTSQLSPWRWADRIPASLLGHGLRVRMWMFALRKRKQICDCPRDGMTPQTSP